MAVSSVGISTQCERQLMKIKPEHVEAMRELITPLDTDTTRKAYRNGQYPRAELTKDVNRRYRWDLMWAARAHDVIKNAEYNDAHIDTALRSIVPTL